MENSFTIELPEKTKVRQVMYADAPLRLNGVPSEITLDELYKKVKQPFIYSEALFSKEKHEPYLKPNSNSTTLPTSSLRKQFEQCGFTDISSFVICNMGRLGHGVFANRDFKIGECFILYAGVITSNSADLGTENQSTYAFAYGNEINLSVDATETGNISRFIQHMPMNFESFRQKAIHNTSLNFNEEQLQALKNSSDYWQWRNLIYKSGLKKEDIAWANLSMLMIPIQGVPCLVLYNTQKIHKGDQLGISYGSGYWTRRGIKPELFDLKGDIVPTSHYGYKEIDISLPIMELFNQDPIVQKLGVNTTYNAAMFQQDLQRKIEVMQPVWFSYVAEPVSIFKLRELLLEYSVIDKEYADINNTFVEELRDILPLEFKVKMFARDPKRPSSKLIFDVVCTTDDLTKWSQLTTLIKNTVLATTIENKCLKLTQEVILMDIGNAIQKQKLLLTWLEEAKEQGFFARALPENLIPIGPSSRNKTSLMKANSDEAFNQILRHNPDLKKEDIIKHYQLVESVYNSMANLTLNNNASIIDDKAEKLNTITSTFFHNKAPTDWKIYPFERLTGKYKGHHVKFFTFPVEQSTQAEPFFNRLKQNGFDTELKKANNKPSLVVDLTTSKLTLK